MYSNFLEFKNQYGNSIEKAIYNNMTLTGFVQRLLTKRCASFIGVNDKYLLLTGERGASGFVDIGTYKQKPALILENCLSYDEIKLSALLSVSSYTDFINNGYRQNCGLVETDKKKIENEGIIIGMIGARLNRREFMEFQDIVLAEKQNVASNGYGPNPESFDDDEIEKKFQYRSLWNKFYEEQSLLFKSVKKDNVRFGNSKNSKDIFDSLLMKKRYTISFDTLLLETESRAAKEGKQAYLHVVGIGLGVWKVCDQQEKIFMDVFEQRIKYLLPKLKHISFIDFSWFKLDKSGEIENGNKIKSSDHPDGGIKIIVSKRSPADKLNKNNLLLVVSYAWDGNALPGNEYWMNMLKSTSDSATACSTLITELHNPHINRTMVSGSNLHIVTEKGVLHISEYAKNCLKSV